MRWSRCLKEERSRRTVRELSPQINYILKYFGEPIGILRVKNLELPFLKVS